MPAGCSRPEDVAQQSNATKTVDCAERHTAETFAVGDLPEELQDVDYDAAELGAFAYETCGDEFETFLGADESLVMRTVVSWAWFRPSEKAWDKGARWYRCDVVGGGEQSKRFVDLPTTARGLLEGKPKDKWLVCVNGESVQDGAEDPLHRAARLACGHHDQARPARGPLPRRPARRGRAPATSARTRWAPGSATRPSTTSATRGSTRPSGRPATVARCAGRRPRREPAGSRCSCVAALGARRLLGRRRTRSPTPTPSAAAHPSAPPTAAPPAAAAEAAASAVGSASTRRSHRPTATRSSAAATPHTGQTYAVGQLRTVVAGHLVAVDSERVQEQVARRPARASSRRSSARPTRRCG